MTPTTGQMERGWRGPSDEDAAPAQPPPGISQACASRWRWQENPQQCLPAHRSPGAPAPVTPAFLDGFRESPLPGPVAFSGLSEHRDAGLSSLLHEKAAVVASILAHAATEKLPGLSEHSALAF